MARDRHDITDALWWHSSKEPRPEAPRLEGEVRADVAIVGAGYTGLSTALHLAESGASAVVLEAKEVGWGASGRNAGQVLAAMKMDPDAAERLFGPDIGGRMVAISAAAPDLVWGLAEKHRMACDADRRGWLQPAHSEAALATIGRRRDQWGKRGVEGILLDRQQTAERLGADLYLGAWIDPRAGGIQPLAFARGLARAAMAAGARVHGDSPVTSVRREGGRWRVETARGAVVADQVVLATNAYTGNLWPGLKRTIVPVRPYAVSTVPLSHNLARSILPGGEVASDTRRLLAYYRKDAEGRLITGGRATFDHGAHPEIPRKLQQAARTRLPQIADVPFEYAWSGWTALTADGVAHIHELDKGLWTIIGCQARGLALMTALGRDLAAKLRDGAKPGEGWPVTPMQPLPFHAFRAPVLKAIRVYYRWMDSRGK